MAKEFKKRKAEDSAQQAAGSSRTKKPRTILKPAVDEEEDELSQNHGSESSGLFVRQDPPLKHVRLPKKAVKEKVVKEVRVEKKRGGRAARIVEEEEEEDFGRTESQQFLEMVRMGGRKKKVAKKANEYLENFKKIVKKEQMALQTFLDEKDADSSERHESFLEDFQSVYTSAMRPFALPSPPPKDVENKVPNEPTSKPVVKENRLKKQSDAVLKDASDLIGEYERCEELLKTLAKTITLVQKAKGEVEKAKRTLEGGKLLGERKVMSIMTNVADTAINEMGESQKQGGEALYQRGVDKGAWAEVTKKQERVVRKMTRLLPIDY